MIPDLKIYDVLKVSFDGLDDTQRDVFLDIACFFNGEYIKVVRHTLDACGFFPDIAFAVLKDKALITMDGTMQMHDLLQEMGREIVREESDEPGKRSRLCIPEDIHQVLTKSMGTRAVEAISLDMSKTREMHIEANAFAGMARFRLLNFYDDKPESGSTTGHVHLHQGLQTLPNHLRYLQWCRFPLKSLPSNFCAENLVKLQLRDSRVEQLWTGVQNLVNLTEIDLSHSEYITTIPDLSNAKNIRTIDLDGCKSLIELPSSIQHLNKLENIRLRQCKNLIHLPDRIDSKCLTELSLTRCLNLKKCPEIFGKLSFLDLGYTAISELPQSIEKLTIINMLNLDGCSNITKFPNVSPNTKFLYLADNAIERVPSSSIQFLTGLVSLKIANNKKLLSLPSSIFTLKSLQKLCLPGCSKFDSFPEILEPVEALCGLDLGGTAIKELPSTIKHLKSLSTLSLENCETLVSLPSTIQMLSKLYMICLSNCIRLRALPQFPESLELLFANQCYSLETLSSRSKCNLKSLQFANCFKLQDTSIQLIAKKNCISGEESRILFPGKDIPQWFRDKSAGSSVTTRLPLSLYQIMKVTLCVVFELEEPPRSMDLFSPSEYWIRCKCYVTKDGDSCEDRDIIWDWRWFDVNIHLVESDHVLIWSKPFVKPEHGSSVLDEDVWFNKYSGKEALFEFYFEGYSEFLNIGKCKVKKCGVLILYDDDEAVPDKNHASDSEQDLPQPKKTRLHAIV